MSRRRLSTAIPLTLFGITLVTGLVGWSGYHLGADGRPAWGDALYNTLLAFTGDGSYLEATSDGPPRAPREDPWLRVARFTGLATTISAVIGLLAAFIGGRMLRGLAGLLRGHSVVIGASGFAVDHAARGGLVTVFDTGDALDRLPPGRRSLRLADNMGAPGTGWSLGRKPAQVVFGAADSITNVERARAWLSGVPERRRGKARLVLRVEDKSVARDLDLLYPEFAKAALISRAETVARALVTSMAPTALAEIRGRKRVHVALVGLGSVNLAVAEELVLRCHHPLQGRLRATVVDRDPAAALARLRAQRPDLLNPDFEPDGPEFAFVEMDALECCAGGAADELFAAETAVPITAIVVAAGEDTRNAGIAMRLRQLQVERLRLRAPIYMRSDSQTSIAAAIPDDLTGGIVPFGGRILDAEDIELDRIHHDLARTVHETWRGSPDVTRSPANAWDALSEPHRRSSYRAALFAVELFRASRLAPSPASPLSGLRVHPVAARAVLGDEALIEDLARTEHRRWNAERRAEGFRHSGGGPRDVEKKLHPLIVPFDDLLPDQRRKDERNVREAFRCGVQRHEEAPASDCWRRTLRVGVIGSLRADEETLGPQLREAFEALLERTASPEARTLEVVTPNAPGFDRIAALHLARSWRRRFGRPARILLMNAARPSLVDRIAAEHIGARPLANLEDEEVDALLRPLRAQSSALHALQQDGHLVQTMDLRPLGMSDAELDADRAAYEQTIMGVQAAVLALADEMMFDTANGTARWTMRAAELWEAQGGVPLQVA